MHKDAKILVATEAVGDAEAIECQLHEEYVRVASISEPNELAGAFDEFEPEILILAYEDLRISEREYLGLCLNSAIINPANHRTIVFCTKNNVKEVYMLCRRNFFDDYVLYWPLTYDTHRLLMAVNRALRDLHAEPGQRSTLLALAEKASQLEGLETVLGENVKGNKDCLSGLGKSVHIARKEIRSSVDRMTSKVNELQHSGLIAPNLLELLQKELAGLTHQEQQGFMEEISQGLNHALNKALDLERTAAQHLETVQSIGNMAKNIHPVLLFIDDEASQLTLFRRFLEAERLEIHTADSGSKALAILKERRVDLIFVDLKMPGMNGLEFIKRVRSIERFSRLPVLVVSGYSDRDTVTKCYRAGASGFLVKPFDKQLLIRKMNRFFPNLAG